MLNDIIKDLGENYNASDNLVLRSILDKATTNALFISNRAKTQENIDLLSDEIKDFTKTIYLQRGSEDVKSLSQSGLSSTYKDAFEELRNNIIKNGKRRLK